MLVLVRYSTLPLIPKDLDIKITGNNALLFEIENSALPKGGYLYLLLNSDIGADMEGDYYLLDVDAEDFIEYYKFLEYRLDFEVREDLFDFMGHPNILNYPLDFWKVKLLDDRIRNTWYDFQKDKYYALTEIAIQDQSRVNEVLTCIPGSLPPNHYIAGGAVLYLAGITNKFKDVDIFSCDKNETIEYIKREHAPDYYGVYHSGNAITFRSRVAIQFILREYSGPSQIVHGFDVGCCSILFDGKKLWATNKALYCIDNMTNWFEPDRSSPTYATRLAKYHIRGFMLRFPSTEELGIDGEYLDKMENRILNTYYNKDNNTELMDYGEASNIYINRDDIIIAHNMFGYKYNNRFINLLNAQSGTVDPEELIKALEDPNNSNKTYEEIVHDIFRYPKTVKYVDLIDQVEEQNIHLDIELFINKYTKIHMSSDPLANQAASALFLLHKSNIDIKNNPVPSDPMSIMILTSMFGYSPSILIKHKISDYEAGTSSNHVTNIDSIGWYESNPMDQNTDLTGTFYPEPILEDVREFYKSSPLILPYSAIPIAPRRWYKKRHQYKL